MARKKLTSREAYNRILWDKRLDRGAFTLGISDRHAGIEEMHFLDWNPCGDIPWHRIVWIKCGPTIVWARDQEEDALDSGRLPVRAWLEYPG